MNGVNFLYTPSTDEQSEAFHAMRIKHIQETSMFDDKFYLTQIFNYLTSTYNNMKPECRNSLKQKKEEDITDYIRRELQNNQDFALDGFLVNTEARNNSNIVGYYDLKFEHSDWLNEYLVLECKPINSSKSKIDSYIHKTIKNKGEETEDGGLYRFLINKYATDKPFGGMLGYIISDKPNAVITKLKNTLQSFQISKNDLCFGHLQNSELLETPIVNYDYSFQSNHVRICKDKIISPIHIFHIFFDLT